MQGINQLPCEFQMGDKIDLKNLEVIGVSFDQEGVYYTLKLTISKKTEIAEEDFYILADIPESILLSTPTK